MYIINTHKMSTLGKKDVRINLKLKSLLREEFQAASHLRGASMSSLLHQHIVKTVREEKERNPEEFARALEFVRRVGADEEANRVYGEANIQGSTSIVADGTVKQAAEKDDAKKLPGDLAEAERPDNESVPVTDTPERINENRRHKGKRENRPPKRTSNGK